MADYQKRTVIGDQPRLHGGDGVKIEVIGRFVENKQLRRLFATEDTSQTGTQHLPARQMPDRLQARIATKHEAGESRPAGIFTGSRVETHEIVPD